MWKSEKDSRIKVREPIYCSLYLDASAAKSAEPCSTVSITRCNPSIWVQWATVLTASR